jgi:hypothetical protein
MLLASVSSDIAAKLSVLSFQDFQPLYDQGLGCGTFSSTDNSYLSYAYLVHCIRNWPTCHFDEFLNHSKLRNNLLGCILLGMTHPRTSLQIDTKTGSRLPP